MSSADDAPDTSGLPAELVITLDPPVTHRGGTFDVLSLREPKAFEVRQAEALIGQTATIASLRAYQMALVSKISGWPPGAVEQLPITKLDEAGRYVMGFTRLGPPTGENS